MLGGSGINESTINGLTAFYNQGNHTFVVNSLEQTASQAVCLYDSKGGLVYTFVINGPQAVIDATPFMNGLYIITNHQGWSQKLMKY